ncbi:MAG TPA: acyl-ACP desaturase [Anaeromyxobacter sp.]
MSLLYAELFKTLERARWNLADDVPWDRFDAAALTDEQARTIRLNAITEWSALPATEMFLRDNRHDEDFSAFMSIWFYEEQKHALVLMEYLRRFRPDLVPTEAELHAVRFDFDPAPPLETLMLHFCGELRLTRWYRRAAEWHTEPVIRRVYELISEDEARHGGAYLRYMQRAMDETPEAARAAFAKVGVLMASSGLSGKPLHPTNLHVNRSLFPNDTVQGRLPDPGWLDRWLTEQIRFDPECEERVVRAILRSLSALFGETFETTRDLNRFRKAAAARALRATAPEAAPAAGAEAG